MTNKHLFTLVYIELNLVWTEYLIEKLKMYSEPKSCTPNVFFFFWKVSEHQGSQSGLWTILVSRGQ